MTTKLSSICVYCGSRYGKEDEYKEAAEILGKSIAEGGLKLVFGGGTRGLMGATAGAARDAGGEVLGIIPEFLKKQEGLLDDIDHVIVETMHERKIKMFDACDAFCVLPGGIGTLEEMVEVMSWSSLALHKKPIILCNIDGYWDPFIELINHVSDGGFAYPGLRDMLIVVDKAEDVVAAAREASAAAPSMAKV
ncbi:MAG: TIGR00730 family Rossman fold protein [Parvularculaceae bacterium]|nr:TIGR00730 family Rossman fold protein [Parvularculaceae bacterium]